MVSTLKYERKIFDFYVEKNNVFHTKYACIGFALYLLRKDKYYEDIAQAICGQLKFSNMYLHKNLNPNRVKYISKEGVKFWYKYYRDNYDVYKADRFVGYRDIIKFI